MKSVKLRTNFDGVLSPLEHDVLNVLWPDKQMRVRELHDVVRKRKKVALTSVAVILDRLFEKGVVDRKIETARGGLRYIYFPKKDQKEFEKSVIETTVNSLIEKFGGTATAYFQERFKSR